MPMFSFLSDVKLWSLVLIVLGEVFAIGSEMVGSHKYNVEHQSFLSIFGKLVLPIIVGSLCLLAGYMLGYKAFKNIWIVSAISVTSILVVEPTLAWFLFKELPTLGASIGIGLGVVGLIVALVF
jgi:uncharacterized membrane protein